jgi:glucose/arabinose dehydrogenase
LRFGGSLVLCAALWAATASAQPEIVDPTPDDDATDWELGLEQDPVVSGLATPTGLVFVGTRKNEELLVLEKNSGRVRHFDNDALGNAIDQGDALDLGVDNCGERGLVAIVLHPDFDRSTPDSSDPDAPEKDWVYLSYHTDDGAGPADDGCDGGAVFRVERRTWNGATLADPVVLFSKALADGEDTQVSGAIAIARELDIGEPDFFSEMLYIAIGSLGRNGTLQNNEDVPRVLDDTSVVLRLRADDGSTPGNNPFDADEDGEEPEDRYFGYGFRDAKAMVIDPSTTFPWLSERSVDGDDEIDLFLAATNGGFGDYQGFQRSVPDNLDEDDQPNPLYPLVDLQTGIKNNTTIPISTYLNPAFSFEPTDLHPTGLAFGGVEVGPQHRDDLFVGTEDGRLLRFNMNVFRLGFSLASTLADTVANVAVPDDPMTPEDESGPADELTQILIADGFGTISDLEAGVDGSLYVVDQTNGSIHRIFYDALRDLAVASIKAPKKITLSAKKPVVSKQLKLTLENRGEVAERIQSREELTNLLGLEITSPTGCAAPTATVVDPKYALPPYPYLIGIAPGGRLSLQVAVEWTCASPSPAGVADFEVSLSLDMEAIGIVETDDGSDNLCPRPPAPMADPPDPGCGAKQPDGTLGGPVATDLILK